MEKIMNNELLHWLSNKGFDPENTPRFELIREIENKDLILEAALSQRESLVISLLEVGAKPPALPTLPMTTIMHKLSMMESNDSLLSVIESLASAQPALLNKRDLQGSTPFLISLIREDLPLAIKFAELGSNVKTSNLLGADSIDLILSMQESEKGQELFTYLNLNQVDQKGTNFLLI